MMTGNELIQQIKLALDKYSASSSAVIGPAFLDSEIMAFANQAMVQVISTKFTGNNELAQGFEDSVKRVSDLEHLIVGQSYDLHYTERNDVYVSNVLTTKYDAFHKNVNGVWNENEAYDLLFAVRATLKLKSIYTITSEDEYGRPVTERRLKTVYEVEAKPTTQQHIFKFVSTPTNKPYIPNPMYTSNQMYNEGRDVNKLRLTSRGFRVCVDPVLLEEHPLIVDYNDPNVNPTDKYVYSFTVFYVQKPEDLTENNIGSSAFGGAFKDTVLYEIINKAALLMLDNIESERVQNKSQLNKTQE